MPGFGFIITNFFFREQYQMLVEVVMVVGIKDFLFDLFFYYSCSVAAYIFIYRKSSKISNHVVHTYGMDGCVFDLIHGNTFWLCFSSIFPLPWSIIIIQTVSLLIFCVYVVLNFFFIKNHNTFVDTKRQSVSIKNFVQGFCDRITNTAKQKQPTIN